MKKFLSLLLAMTMVMSLIVLPARAHDGVTASAAKANLELNINDNKSTEVTFSGLSDTTDVTYQWTASSDSVVDLTNATQPTATATAKAAGSVTLTCTATKNEQTVGTASCSVTVYDYKKAITAITYNGRSYNVTNNADSHTATVNYVASEVAEAATPAWGVVAAGYTATLKTAPSGKIGNLQVVYTVKSPADSVGQDVTVAANMTEVSAPTANISSPDSNNCVAGQNVTFAVSSPNTLPTGASYVWTYKQGGKSSTASPQTLPGTQSGQNFTFKAPSTPGDYTIYCAIKLDSNAATGAGEGVTIKVNEDKNKYTVTAPTAATSELNGKTVNYGFKFENTAVSPATAISLADTNITWTVTSGSATFAKMTDKGNSNGTASNTLTLGNTAGNVTVKATFTYLGKNYTVTFPTITNVVPTYTLGSTYCGYNNSVYRANELVSYATSALTTAGITGVTVGSVALASASGNVVTATGAEATGYTLTASPTYLGTADLTATVTKSGGGTFKMTFKVPVLPIPYSTSLGTVNAEPYTTGSTYYNNTYRVTLPTTFNQYYVVSKNTTPNYNVSAAPASGVTTVTLNQNEFVNGQCTLYVIAWNSNYNGYGYGYNYGTNYYGKYYSGAITVTQTNHDIKYNGVVGGTVQFKHNDFTTFMNEMYGTNTTSYLTFNSVKFTSVPNATTQGTLYYNGVAMTTGYGSNYFNTSTAVTNLDNVSFSVSSRVPSTTKEIRIPFTLYATRYNSYGTSAGTSVTYSGVVVISLVREDVTFTVAPGDSVRFTDSAFLTYLRSASGINYNYNIDYVTFDQSAVNALNEGVLYAYSTGFNAVKTTDKFYYTTTNYNQNALSDVTFRASTYAKTGTTVYIPFTIYAKYGTSSATRQVTGTVAIKIAQTMNFVDVKTSDYFYDSVKWAVNNNITKGTSATTFSPNNTCTRAEIVTFLWRAAGSPTPTITRNPFTDVKYSVGSDFYNAILWASQNGIAAGTSTTTFAPNDNCTRAQIVTFLWRYAKKPLGYYTNPFNDVNKTEYAAYYDAILWAAGKGIATGNTPKTFNPDGTCTRAEAVTFLYRYESTK